jgi:hypothetical protein
MSGFGVFTPKTTGTTSITSAVTTSAVALTKPGTATVIRVKNIDATNYAYVNFGTSTITATVPAGATPGSMPVGPTESIMVGVAEGVTHAASICTAGTPIVHFTPGNAS